MNIRDYESRRLPINRNLKYVFVIVLFSLVIPPAYSGDTKILFREDFATLQNWKPLHFPKIPEHTVYSIETDGNGAYLKAESNASASALIYKEGFNVFEYPKARWKWKVSNVYKKADPETKSGDDYPIRVYIIFKYDPDKASMPEKIKYGFAKKIYGEYPPHSTLNYVWASRDNQKATTTSPYTDRVKVIALEKGGSKAGTWQGEDVHIVSDYRRAFGSYPPEIASIAIMNDSDNTKEMSVSYIDFIEVFKYGE